MAHEGVVHADVHDGERVADELTLDGDAVNDNVAASRVPASSSLHWSLEAALPAVPKRMEPKAASSTGARRKARR